jgi:hypothetical protein
METNFRAVLAFGNFVPQSRMRVEHIHPNSEDAKFCSTCGKPLTEDCFVFKLDGEKYDLYEEFSAIDSLTGFVGDEIVRVGVNDFKIWRVTNHDTTSYAFGPLFDQDRLLTIEKLKLYGIYNEDEFGIYLLLLDE